MEHLRLMVFFVGSKGEPDKGIQQGMFSLVRLGTNICVCLTTPKVTCGVSFLGNGNPNSLPARFTFLALVLSFLDNLSKPPPK